MVAFQDSLAVFGEVPALALQPAGFLSAPEPHLARAALIDFTAATGPAHLADWRAMAGMRPALALIGASRGALRRTAFALGIDDVLSDLSDGATLRRLIALHSGPPTPIDPDDLPAPGLRLGRGERALLSRLCAAGGRVVEVPELIRAAWGAADINGVNKLRVAVRRLRLAFEPDPAWPRVILSEPGVGYRLMRPPYPGSVPAPAPFHVAMAPEAIIG